MIFSLQIRILIIFILIYLSWALWHHKRDKSLTLEVMLEYILTATLVLIILMGVSLS